MKVKVIVATHKTYEMSQDSLYLPVQVGAAGKGSLGYQRDDEGDNISTLNPAFCELTGLYWAWKNLDADAIGLCHYRRYFRGVGKGDKAFDKVLTENEAKALLTTYDCVVPKKRRYVIETVHSHYEHTHYPEPLDEAGRIIRERYPEYAPYFDKQMKRRSFHAFNMMIMKRELFDQYCEWMFDILFSVYDTYKDVDYTPFHARFPGRVGEILLDVWLMKNDVSVKEIPFIYMEKINYARKVIGFLQAKVIHKKYDGSF